MNSPDEIKLENNNINQNKGDTEEKENTLNKEEAQKIEEIRKENRIIETEEDKNKKPSCKCNCSIF